MAWDLATAKAWLGITGTDQDAEVQAAMDAVMLIAERYCNRRFLKAQEIETFNGDVATVLLSRVPVESITSVVAGESTLDPETGYVSDKRTGIVRCCCDHRCRCWCGCVITIDYVGGFDPLPADLEMALYGCLGVLWARMQTPPGEAAAATGPMKSMVLFDFARIDYDTSAITGDGGGAGVHPAIAGELAIFDGYRFLWGVE
jgi:hypothetical protein